MLRICVHTLYVYFYIFCCSYLRGCLCVHVCLVDLLLGFFFFLFFCWFFVFLDTIIWYQVFQSETNNFQTDLFNPSQSESESSGNKGLLYTSQNSRIRSLPSHGVSVISKTTLCFVFDLKSEEKSRPSTALLGLAGILRKVLETWGTCSH